MIYDKKRNRFLTKNGESIVSVTNYCQKMIENRDFLDDSIKIIEPEEAKKVYDLYQKSILTDTQATHEEIENRDDGGCRVEEQPPFERQYGDVEKKKEYIIEKIASSTRKRADNSDIDRIEHELNFFFDEDRYIDLIYQVIQLIEGFKEKNVVWSGRGSSCASYVFYLIGVHDVDAFYYEIPFSEMSKESIDTFS